jgi:hypothetical protein
MAQFSKQETRQRPGVTTSCGYCSKNAASLKECDLPITSRPIPGPTEYTLTVQVASGVDRSL